MSKENQLNKEELELTIKLIDEFTVNIKIKDGFEVFRICGNVLSKLKNQIKEAQDGS